MRIALRTLLQSPGFTIIALVTLALGVGVNTSMYTLIVALLFRPAPFPEPEQLVYVHGQNAQGRNQNFAFAETEELHAHAASSALPDGATEQRPFETLTAMTFGRTTLAEPGKPAERLTAYESTADFFRMFRVQPMLGRAFTAEEQTPGRNQVALLSYDFWQKHFGGDPAVIGRPLRLNSEQVTVIGVMPAAFKYPLFFGPVDLWRPNTIARHVVENRQNRFFFVVARLNPGVTLTQARAQLSPLADRWAQDHPHLSAGGRIDLRLMHKAAMGHTGRFLLWLLFGLAGTVLLLACANLANLQLARATAKARDLAIRSALGASRARSILHQLTESLLLALAGGVGGILVALAVNTVLGRALRMGDPAGVPLPLNLTALGLAFAVSLLAGVLFGLAPAWFAARQDLVTTLKQQSRGATTGKGHRTARHLLIVAEVALALALLSVAGVMTRGMAALLSRDLGWDQDRIIAANIQLPEQSTYAEPERRRVAIRKLEQRLRQIPGAELTAVCSAIPVFSYSLTLPVHVDGVTAEDPSHQPLAGWTIVGPDFFPVMGIPFKEGRDFPRDLQPDHPDTVIVGETLARQFWPNKSAVGQRLGTREGDTVVWREVIGVVRDVEFALSTAQPPTMLQVYRSTVHAPWGYLHLLVRGESPARFKEELRRVVFDVDPDVAVQEMYTIPEAAARYQHDLFIINRTLSGFAVLGLVLAAVGLYGVISHLVAHRTAEFGIRLALGAQPRDVLLLVLRTGVLLTTIGLIIGAVAGVALNLALRDHLPRMAAFDPVTIAGVAVVLFLVALFSCWWPARRATKVDPLTALRAE